MLTPAERKKQLIAQGALYRAEVVAARATLTDALRPETLARSVWQHVAATALSALRGGIAGSGPLNVQTMLPLVLSGVSAVARRTGFKPLLRAALGAAAAGGAAYLGMRSRKTRRAAVAADEEIDPAG